MTLNEQQYDAVVVGAGFAGLYMLHLLRQGGYSVKAFEAAGDVGGVWYWNRYPGARVDSFSVDYCYMFSEEIFKGWNWSEKYAGHEELRRYFDYVANKLDLRKDIQFNTRVTKAHFDENANKWRIETDKGDKVMAKYFIPATGFLSAPNIPKFKGAENFKGEIYHTGYWPKEKVDFTGKRVGVIGGGSSGIQVITEVAKEAEHLISFQRTPQYSIPLGNKPLDEEYMNQVKAEYHERKRNRFLSDRGRPVVTTGRSVFDDTDEQFEEIYEKAWNEGGFILFEVYTDIMSNIEANKKVSEFVKKKIREIVKDPETAEKLIPDYPFGAKRIVFDSGYFETYNRDNVSLVLLKETPIVSFTEKGILTTETEHELDIIILATGYDAMTGALLKMDIRGRDGISLKEKWDGGNDVKTYLSITLEKFPNMFMIAGPHSPGAFVNGPSLSEFTADWIYDCINFMEENGIEAIEARAEEEEEWTKHVNEAAEGSLFTQVDNWYNGRNIEGKKSGFIVYLAGFLEFQRRCKEGSANEYQKFKLTKNKLVNHN